MFSTIKSRVFVISLLVLAFAVISSLLLGGLITKNYIDQQIYRDMTVMYRVDSGQELDSIASGEYFNKERLVAPPSESNKVHNRDNREFITPMLIATFGLITFFGFIINLGYNLFVKTSIRFDSDNVNDFKQVKQMVNAQNDMIVNTNRDIEKINSYISHELKNSLAILRTKEIGSDEFDDYIREMNKQLDDISALTTNQIGNKTRIDLLLMVASVIDNYQDKNIGFNFQEGNFDIYGNGTLLTRGIDNVINNAFKYGATKVDIQIYNLNQSVVVKISNDGAEIAREQLDRIFDFKYRVPELQKDGSGIGLALVKNIVELHNGGIFAESNEKKTTFYFSFKFI